MIYVDLKNKRVIVTGGAGGIGSATVHALLEAGATVGVVDNNEEKLNTLEDTLSDTLKDQIVFYSVDIGQFEAAERTVRDFFDRFQSIDGLINNAGVLRDGPLISIFGGQLKKYPLKDWHETINSNLHGYFYFAREVAEKMVLERTRGVIINVSSVSAAGNKGQTAYAASKAAVNALTVSWAQELAMFGIRVAGLAPGMTDTPMPRISMNEQQLNQWARRTPMKRMATSQEIAEGILFIFHNEFFCGRVLALDGGLRM